MLHFFSRDDGHLFPILLYSCFDACFITLQAFSFANPPCVYDALTLCANVPEETVIVDLPQEQKFTADGRPLKCIGTDDVRVELIREPSRVYKRVYRCRVYADPKAEEETGKADIRRPHVPAPLLPHSYASASVVTDIIVKKYADALPLYRQEQMWKRLGVDLKRNTMANWVVLTAETYLKPFSDAFLAGVAPTGGDPRG